MTWTWYLAIILIFLYFKIIEVEQFWNISCAIISKYHNKSCCYLHKYTFSIYHFWLQFINLSETGVEVDHGGRVSIALLKLLRLGPEYGHFLLIVILVMPKNKSKMSCEALKERKMKRTREGSSQTDEEVFDDDSHGCPKCKSTNTRLAEIVEKLERLLKLTDEFKTYKN